MASGKPSTKKVNRTSSSVKRKPEAKRNNPLPLRRSERVKKKSDISGKGKTVTLDTNEKRRLLPRKRMDAITYASFFKPNIKKADVAAVELRAQDSVSRVQANEESQEVLTEQEVVSDCSSHN